MALTEENIVPIPGMMSRWVRLPNGAIAHYLTSGDSGPAVVLCHGGLPGSSGTAGWRFMAPFLGANGFRVYCPDFPGYGLSDNRPEYLPVNGRLDHLEFLHMFVNTLSIDRFHLSGNSMGCGNTVNYVITHPERVISFALIAGGVGDLVDPSKRVSGSLDSNKLNRETFDGTSASMLAMMEPIIYRKAAIAQEVLEMRTFAANRQKESLKVLQDSNDRLNKNRNLSQVLTTVNRLNKLNISAIYLYGKDDVLSPVENGYHQEDVGFPNMQFFYPEECGHQGQTDQPEMFNQAFLEFFRDGKVSRKTADWVGVSKRRPELSHIVEQVPVAAGQ